MGNYKAKADRQSNKFMKSARAFLATKLTGNADGEIPPEFELNLTLLESYYKTFIMLQMAINFLLVPILHHLFRIYFDIPPFLSP